MSSPRRILALALALAGCASPPRRNDDAPIPVHTVELPPEVAGTDPHRPGGPLDLKPPPNWDGDSPDAGHRDELPGYMDSPAPGPAGTQGPGANPWAF